MLTFITIAVSAGRLSLAAAHARDVSAPASRGATTRAMIATIGKRCLIVEA
jgi:hypothetical protein